MYHGVRRGKTVINGRHLPLDQFERHLSYFKKNFDIVSLRILCETKEEILNPRRHTIALTFDDGYLNNIDNVLPLLRKYEVPATFFLSAAGLSDKGYIQPTDYLDLINFSLEGVIDIDGLRFQRGAYHLIASDPNRSSVYQFIKRLNLTSFNKTFSALRSVHPTEKVIEGVDEELFRTINGSDLKELVESELITIGSHGHLHVNLSVLSEQEVRDQLETSKNIFCGHGLDDLELFAFPYGNFDGTTVEICKEFGYRFLIAGGVVDQRYKGIVFPRIGILNLGSYSFNMLSVNRGFSRFGF